jgi:hypothetical protein
MVLELVNLVVDLAAAAQALLDGLGGLGRGFLAGAASVVVGVGAERLGVGLGLGAQLGAVLLAPAFEFLGLLLGGPQDVRVDLPTSSSLRVTATSPMSCAASVSSQSTSCSRNLSTSCLS